MNSPPPLFCRDYLFTAWQLAIGGAMLLPIALVVEGPLTHLSPVNLLGFIYLGVIGTGLAYILWFRGIDKLKASAVSYLGLMSPVVATLIGFVWLHQTFTPIQLIGIVLTFTSVLIGQQINSPRRHLSTTSSRSFPRRG